MAVVHTESTTDSSSAVHTAPAHSLVPNVAFFRALIFLLQYEQSRDTVHLEVAIKEYRVLLEETPVDHADYLAFQSFLCAALCEQYDLWGDLGDIEEAVKLGDAVLSASCASHPDYLHHLCCSARSLTFRYEATSSDSDVTRAVDLVEVAKADIEHERADKSCILMLYGDAYALNFSARSDPQFLPQAIASYTAALCILTEASRDRAACLLSLSICHFRSYHLNSVQALSKFARSAREAVDLTTSGDPRLSRTLSILAVAVREQWETDADPQALQEVVFLSKSAIGCLDARDRKRATCLAVYAVGLSRRHDFLGIDDLNEAVRVYERALGMVGKGERRYPQILLNCCSALRRRFRSTGSLEDLDTAIYELQKGMAERSTTESSYQHGRSVLGALVYERYNLLKGLPDLRWVIQISLESLADHPTRGYDLFNAGEAYHLLYQQTGDVTHLNAAIGHFEIGEAGIEAQDDNAAQYADFGTALVSLAHLSAYPSDWDKAIQRLRLAVQHTHPGHSGHSRRHEVLRKLASGLRERFCAMHDAQDIRECISLLSDFMGDAVGHERARFAFALGEAMVSYFHSFWDASYLRLALNNFQSAAKDEEAFISDRFQAALTWATLARDNAYLDSAHNGYRLAVQLLPRVAWVGFGKHVRLQELQKRAATLATDAAAAAIEIGEYESAIELLESGRAIFWSQLLQLRTEVDAIHEVAPTLATELHEVGRALEMDVAGSGGVEGKRLLQRQRRLAERWERLLEEVRKIDGFETFLASPQVGHLLASAEDGPVVIFNASELRCDALIIASNVRTYGCPLPKMRRDYALQLSRVIGQALLVSKDKQGMAFVDRSVTDILDKLWTAVGVPVWNALTELYPDGVPRRIWFCPTGPFCLLPLHAAKPIDGPGFPDLFICSYTATLSSLMRARADRAHARQAVGPPKLLAVSQPATPGYDSLKCAIDEMRVIHDSDLVEATTFLNGSDATVASVCEGMLENQWIHFSCHGSSNTVNPLETCFRFHDGPLNLSRISELRLPHADFAFLSACHTARAFGKLPDEALHLAAGLQLAGFKSVIGTQWSIADIDAPEVAKVVYQYMTQEGRYNHRSAAEGLHRAVNALRSRGVASWRWVPFIHLGV